jgi:hypothetical protein
MLGVSSCRSCAIGAALVCLAASAAHAGIYLSTVTNINGLGAALDANGAELTFGGNTIQAVRVYDRQDPVNWRAGTQNQRVWTVTGAAAAPNGSGAAINVPSSSLAAPAANSRADAYWKYAYSDTQAGSRLESGRWLKDGAATAGVMGIGARTKPNVFPGRTPSSIDFINDSSNSLSLSNIRVWLNVPLDTYDLGAITHVTTSPDLTFPSFVLPGNSTDSRGIPTPLQGYYTLVIADALGGDVPGGSYLIAGAEAVPAPGVLPVLMAAGLVAGRRRRAPRRPDTRHQRQD